MNIAYGSFGGLEEISFILKANKNVNVRLNARALFSHKVQGFLSW